MPTKGRKRSTKKSTPSLKRYIREVMRIKQQQANLPTATLSTTVNALNTMVDELFDRLLGKAGGSAKYDKKKTLDQRDIKLAVQLECKGTLTKHTISEITRATTAYATNDTEENKPKKMSNSKKAGLVFPIGRIHNVIRDRHVTERVSKTAAIAMAAALEYLVTEVIEVAIEELKRTKHKRVTLRHIKLGVSADEDLNELFKNASFVQGGTTPNIHPKLLPKKAKKV